MLYQIIGTAIEIVGRDDMVAIAGNILECIGHSSGTRGHSQSGHSALQRSHPVLKHALGGVGETPVDVASVAQAKTVGRMLRVAEHIRGGLVDRYGTCVGSRVGLLLSYMQLKGLETVLLFTHNSFPFLWFWLICGP